MVFVGRRRGSGVRRTRFSKEGSMRGRVQVGGVAAGVLEPATLSSNPGPAPC